MKKTNAFVCYIVMTMIVCLATSMASKAQLKFSELPYSSTVDSGSYCVGVQNSAGIFSNKRYRIPVPTLSSVLANNNTSNSPLHIHTGTNDLWIDPGYSGFAVKYASGVMAGLKSYYSISGILELSTSFYTTSLMPDYTGTANRTIYLPDGDGVLALRQELPVLRLKTLSGDGTHDSLTFTAPATGTIVQCQSTNNVAQVKFSSMSGTSVMVKFVSPPPSGSNNVSISYWFQ